MQYIRHALWLLSRPFLKPPWVMRHRSKEARQKEIEQYDREGKAAIQEMKIEFLLARRQAELEEQQ